MSRENNHGHNFKELKPWQQYLELAVLALSFYVLGVFVWDVSVGFSQNTHRLLDDIDFVICLVFLFNLWVRWTIEDDKRHFWRSPWTWIDLVSSIPMVGSLRALRIGRVLRLGRVLRSVRACRAIYNWLSESTARRTTFGVLIFSIGVTFIIGILLYRLEGAHNPDISTPHDSFWMALYAFINMGYGDLSTVTLGGRLLALFLVILGMVLLATLTGWMAAWFNDDDEDEIKAKIDLVQVQVDRIGELEAKVDRLTNLLESKL